MISLNKDMIKISQLLGTWQQINYNYCKRWDVHVMRLCSKRFNVILLPQHTNSVHVLIEKPCIFLSFSFPDHMKKHVRVCVHRIMIST